MATLFEDKKSGGNQFLFFSTFPFPCFSFGVFLFSICCIFIE